MNHTTDPQKMQVDPVIKLLRDQEHLTHELHQANDLVGAARLALQQVAASETACIEGVLMLAENNLYDLWQAQRAKLQALEAERDADPTPEEAFTAAREAITAAADNAKARLIAGMADTLKGQFDAAWNCYLESVTDDTGDKLEDMLIKLGYTIGQLHGLHHGNNGGADNG